MNKYSLWADAPVDHIQDLEPDVLVMASCLSKRGRNAFRTLYAQCDENVATLAYTILQPGFSWENSHVRLGESSLAELDGFTSDFLDLLEAYKDSPGLEKWDICQKKAHLARFGIAGDEVNPCCMLNSLWVISHCRHLLMHGSLPGWTGSGTFTSMPLISVSMLKLKKWLI